jgi:Flp pilus assembly protein TadG
MLRNIPMFEQMRDRTSTAIRTVLRRIRREEDGIAAVEFAMILPLMLTLYIGTAEMTNAIMASRKETLVARTLSDLIAQQASGVDLVEADLDGIFNAATAIMAPFNPAVLKMTITSVEFVANAGAASGTGFDAKPRWTAVRNGSTKRPCAVLTKVNNTDTPAANNMPVGIYGAGSVIVADTSYTYVPNFGSTFMSWDTNGITFSHTTYMRPRNTTLINYKPASVPATSTICAAY